MKEEKVKFRGEKVKKELLESAGKKFELKVETEKEREFLERAANGRIRS